MQGECRSDTATSLSADWQVVNGLENDFSFSYPDAWHDESGGTDFPLGLFIEPQTLTEVGLSEEDTSKANVVGASTGMPTVIVFRLDGITSSLEEVHARQVVWLEDQALVEGAITINSRACVAG